MKTYFVRWRDEKGNAMFYSIKAYAKSDAIHDFKRNHPEVFQKPIVSEGF